MLCLISQVRVLPREDVPRAPSHTHRRNEETLTSTEDCEEWVGSQYFMLRCMPLCTDWDLLLVYRPVTCRRNSLYYNKGFSGLHFGEENVSDMPFYLHVRGSPAAGGVAHTALPEVGCWVVKMGSQWLPRAAGEKPPFLKEFYHGRLSFRGLADTGFSSGTNGVHLLGSVRKPFSKCPLLW